MGTNLYNVDKIRLRFDNIALICASMSCMTSSAGISSVSILDDDVVVVEKEETDDS